MKNRMWDQTVGSFDSRADDGWTVNIEYCIKYSNKINFQKKQRVVYYFFNLKSRENGQ